MSIVNPGFEDGDSGWAKGANWTIVQQSGFTRDGVWAARWDGGNGSNSEIINNVREPVTAGQSVTGSLYGSTNGAGSSQGGVHPILVWYNASNTRIGDTPGDIITGGGTSLRQASVTGTAPSGAVTVSIGARAYRNSNPRPYFVDTFAWNIVRNRTIQLIQPTAGQEFAVDQQIPLRVEIGGTAPAITSVSYLINGVAERVVTTAPYGANLSPQPVGVYTVQARLNLVDNTTVLSNTVTINVVAVPEPPTVREYKASNSYTYLIGENFISLGGSMPPTARVLGIEVLVDYTIDVLVRSKDVGIADPSQANYDVAFAVVDGGTVEAVLLNNDGTAYTQLGAPMSNTLPINRSDFTVTEDGTSEGMRWTVLEGVQQQVVIGAEDQRFGLAPEFGSTFINYGVGLRFTPNLAAVPSYADAGDASYRFKVESFKVRVYFDAGSVEYYFASADKTQVLKGTLAAYYVYTGNFKTSDANGVLQLTSELEQMDGTQRWIGSDWTIHSSYPPTDVNQIGEVGEVEDELGMQYNGLPTQKQVLDNRSRYEFKTENFYGSTELNSMYGVHGLPRAFAFNGDFFYKIYTQADAEKDSPRHVANHHGHLALGYYGGRVDISVAGEPYNFNGVDGSSSWAFGDKVVGLLPLSGTILGVFGAKSVWGISGTTVDNFATQVISPNMGAVEYTITDMGFPVYANSYGIYTLNQTQQYGDYLGQPMSQDISPWLRPRLIRKLTSDKEVVCAFPVRSKSQYRLCFSDGYVTSMTLNGQQVPTFSFQKYFYTPEEGELPDSLFSYPSIVPAAVSSELDEAGEERIHIANIAASSYVNIQGPSIVGQAPDTFIFSDYSYAYTLIAADAPILGVSSTNLPPGLILSQDGVLSGSPTQGGVFTFTLTVVDTNGLIGKLTDTIEVEAVWALTQVRDASTTQLWISSNPLVWPEELLIAPFAPMPGFGSTYLEDGKLITLPNSVGYGASINFPPEDGVILSERIDLNNIVRVRTVSGITFAFTNTGTYYYKLPNSATWATVTLPEGRITDIVRVDSGRWISYRQDNANSGFIFTDQEVPTVWQVGADEVQAQTNYAMATDGEVVLLLATNARTYRTTDGVNVETLIGTGLEYPDSRDAIFVNNRFVFTGQTSGSTSNVLFSDNKGVTFTRSSIAGLSSIERIDYYDGTWVASGTATTPASDSLVYVSTNNMATWQPSAIPFTFSGGDKAVVTLLG